MMNSVTNWSSRPDLNEGYFKIPLEFLLVGSHYSRRGAVSWGNAVAAFCGTILKNIRQSIVGKGKSFFEGGGSPL